MSENKFDKEKIDVVHNDDLPKTFMAFDNEKVYDIRQKRNAWWKCPKCGGGIEFGCMDFVDDEVLIDGVTENQLIGFFTWYCGCCDAEGSVHTALNAQYISIVQEDDEDDDFDDED